MPLISPSLETRNVKLLRCSKHTEDNTWVIADMSVYFSSYGRHLHPKFMRFPSGYLVERIANGLSRVNFSFSRAYSLYIYDDRFDLTPLLNVGNHY